MKIIEKIKKFFELRNEIKKFKKEIVLKINNEINSFNTIDDNNEVLKNILIKGAELKISEKLIIKKLDELRNLHINSFIKSRLEDNLLSDKEYDEICNETNRLSIQLGNLNVLEKFREYWRIISNDLPFINVDINLKKGENCYYTSNIDWYEYRKITTRVNYGGITGRIKIVKGVSFRCGSIVPNIVSTDVITKIDSGRFFITNKRIIFIGNYNNKNINLSSILDIVEYSDGITIQKDSGKSPFIKTKDDLHKINLILSKLINQ